MPVRLLIVEDDVELLNSITRYLTFEKYNVTALSNGLDGLEHVLTDSYDILILDWELPDNSGLDIVRKARANGVAAPILMLTGKSSISDKEAGFGSGADDYLTKPFVMQELALRLNALLRRAHLVAPDAVLNYGPFELASDKFLFKKNGSEMRLLPKEFALMNFLMSKPETVFSADELLKRIWFDSPDCSSEAVAACIKRLRKKIDAPDAKESYIRTIYGLGYKLQRVD